MTDCLFVYGTLMRAAEHAALGREQRQRLEAAGEWLGAASTAGRLLDRGRYPLLLAAASPADVAHGEVYRLRAPADAFAFLDPYEGIPRGTTIGREYQRLVRPVSLADGRRLDAWMYVFTGTAASLPAIPDGRWRP